MADDKSPSGAAPDPAGRWVECFWNFAAGQGEPHTDDREAIARLCPRGASARCVGAEGRFLTLLVGGTLVRVRPFSTLVRAREPAYLPGRWVRTVAGPRVRTVLTAPVRETVWHVTHQEWTYLLRVAGRRRNRYYFESELVAVLEGGESPGTAVPGL